MITMSHKLSNKLFFDKIPPHAYNHASPCMHNSPFNTAWPVISPSPAREVPKRQNLQINHNGSLAHSFDITLNKKKSRMEKCSILSSGLSFCLPRKCTDWRSKSKDCQSSVQLDFSTASCCLSVKNISHLLSVLCVLWCIFFDSTENQYPQEHSIKPSGMMFKLNVPKMVVLFS